MQKAIENYGFSCSENSFNVAQQLQSVFESTNGKSEFSDWGSIQVHFTKLDYDDAT